MAVSKINLMIVDDELLFREGLVYLLKKYGIETTSVADNGEQALERLKKYSPDLVLLDLEMPILNGSITLDKMLMQYPNIKVIIITSYHDEELIKDHFNRGAFGFVSKKEEIKTVVSAIKSVHKGIVYEKNIPDLIKMKCEKNGHYYQLIYSEREKEIINHLCKAVSVKDISKKLSIAGSTIETQLTAIYKKANVKNRAEFLALAFDKGLQYLGSKYVQE